MTFFLEIVGGVVVGGLLLVALYAAIMTYAWSRGGM